MITFPPELNEWQIIERTRRSYLGFGGSLGRQGENPGFGRNATGCTLTSDWMCNCCGSGEIHKVSFQIPNKENFLSAFFNLVGTTRITWYFIADDYQLGNLTDGSGWYFQDFINLMVECGAKEIDATENQVHGPSKMHMYVWAPHLNLDKLAKYIDVQYTFDPVWWTKLTTPERMEYITKHQEKIDQVLAEKVKANKSAKEIELNRDKLTLMDLMRKHPGFVKEIQSDTKIKF